MARTDVALKFACSTCEPDPEWQELFIDVLSDGGKGSVPKSSAPLTTQPRPEELANLVFSFETDDIGKFPCLETTVPLEHGAVSVSVVARATGAISAKNGWLTLIICNECRYAEEPWNTVPMAAHGEIARQRQFQEIYAGTISVPIKLKIIPPKAPYDKIFNIGGRYVCDNCPPDDPKATQLLTVNVR